MSADGTNESVPQIEAIECESMLFGISTLELSESPSNTMENSF